MGEAGTPVITVTLIEGYDEATRRDSAERLTDAVVSTIGAPLEGTIVVVNEVTAVNYMCGRTSRTPGRPPPAPAQVVRDDLGAMERRNFEAATRLLAPEFTMTFPGGAVFRRPEPVVDWAKGRYRSVAKTYERFDEATGNDDGAVGQGLPPSAAANQSAIWLPVMKMVSSRPSRSSTIRSR